MVFSPDDGHIVGPNMYRRAINIFRKIVHRVGSFCETIAIIFVPSGDISIIMPCQNEYFFPMAKIILSHMSKWFTANDLPQIWMKQI
jgi:hypothetical protein